MYNFTRPKMRHLGFLLASVLLLPELGYSQKDDPAEVVLKLLSTNPHFARDSISVHLEGHSWESLAYWESGTKADRSQLSEAVPDIYRFKDGAFDLLLFAKEERDKRRISGVYQLKGDRLLFYSVSDRTLLDSWTIHYLNADYLAVDMDGLRVFFVAPD
jgi:hypothetical protein